MFDLSRNHRTAWFLAATLATGSLAFAFSAAPVHAAPPVTTVTFNVTPTSGGGGDAACEATPLSACSFQEALNVAGGNASNNIINLAAGTYNEEEYTYQAETDEASLTITGADPETTFISNTGVETRGLQINTSGEVTVENISFINNTWTGLGINDLSIGGENGTYDIVVENCVFEGNFPSGLYVGANHLNGSLLVDSVTFTDNISDANGGAFHVNAASGISFPVTLTDVTATNNSVEAASGGAGYIRLQGNSSPVVVTGSTFTNNTAVTTGGGLYIDVTGTGNTVTIGGDGEGQGNLFTGNSTADDHGGGFSVTTSGLNSPITVVGNTAKGNSSAWGGGFYLDTNGTGDSSMTVTDNTIGGTEEGEGNTSTTDGGGAFMWVGGGITFENNTIIGNTSADAYIGGGGVAFYVDRDGVNTSPALITHNIIRENTATRGGGMGIISSCDCAITVDANLLSENFATVVGGGIEMTLSETGSPTRVRNNLIINNITSGTVGGGMHLDVFRAQDTDMINNIFVGNRLANSVNSAGGAGLYTNFSSGSLDLNFYNNIFWDNTASMELQTGGMDVLTAGTFGTLNFNNNIATDVCHETDDLVCNDGESYADLGYTTANNNLHATDPRFVDADAEDYRLGTISAAIASGDSDAPNLPSEDYAGDALNDPPDMGAYRFDDSDYPIVETGDALDINATRATLAGTVTDEGGDTVTRRGIVYGRIGEDYPYMTAQEEGVTEDEEFSLLLAGLACGTSYEYIIFATSESGTGYGDSETFRTQSCSSSGGGGGSNGGGGGSSSLLTSAPLPSFTPIWNPTTGHWEAPLSNVVSTSPYNGTEEYISLVSPGWYIRGEHYDTVYYLDNNLNRHPLWDAKTFFTWQDSFESIIWVTDATLQHLTLTSPLLYKPGVVLVKLADQPSIYAIEEGAPSALRLIATEEIAESVYGEDWADYVIDIPSILFPYFGTGTPVISGETMDTTRMKKRTDLN